MLSIDRLSFLIVSGSSTMILKPEILKKTLQENFKMKIYRPYHRVSDSAGLENI